MIFPTALFIVGLLFFGISFLSGGGNSNDLDHNEKRRAVIGNLIGTLLFGTSQACFLISTKVLGIEKLGSGVERWNSDILMIGLSASLLIGAAWCLVLLTGNRKHTKATKLSRNDKRELQLLAQIHNVRVETLIEVREKAVSSY